MADYVQRSSGLLAACGAIDLCRGSPYLEVSGGGFLGNLELPGYLGDLGVLHAQQAYRMDCRRGDCSPPACRLIDDDGGNRGD